jgi:hypothetical protein
VPVSGLAGIGQGAGPPIMDQLTNTERLLLAQAVYQEGANDWFKVSQIISNHPLIGRPKSYFSPSVCTLPSPPNHAIIIRIRSGMQLDLREHGPRCGIRYVSAH